MSDREIIFQGLVRLVRSEAERMDPERGWQAESMQVQSNFHILELVDKVTHGTRFWLGKGIGPSVVLIASSVC